MLSFPSFIIGLRETIEASLIIGIILAYLTRTGNSASKRDIWIGAILGIIVSVLGAIGFQQLLGGFTGTTEKLFEGIMMVSAALLLSFMIIWMFKSSKTLKYDLEKKIEAAVKQDKKYALVTLSFIIVVREGIETVLFLTGISSTEAPSTVFLSGSIGIFVAIILSVLFFKSSFKLNIKQFFNYTSILLIFFAAGLFSHGIHEFQELGVFGLETSFWNTNFLDLSGILNDKTNTIGVMLRALFGYQDKPTPVELVSYLLYWIVITLTYFQVNISMKKNIAGKIAA
jgi:high-affinity iron transporter